jgi:hypothetical protein
MSKIFIFSFFLLITFSCEKPENYTTDVVSTDAIEVRNELQKDGYIETFVDSIFKIDCYFDDIEKNVLTPVSGLIEYYDKKGNWVATIDFGNGNCDQWAVKTWDVALFPDYPKGEKTFSILQYIKKEK